MTSQGFVKHAEISQLLQELSDEEVEGSDSERDDNMLQDDVQSDVED